MPAKQTKESSKTDQRVRKLNRKNKKQVTKIYKKIPSSFSLLNTSFKHIWANKRLLIGIMIVFAALYIVLVRGLVMQFELSQNSAKIDEVIGDGINTPTKAFVLLGSLFGTTGSTSGEAASVYQIFLFIIISLVLIWALRQTFDESTKIKIKIRDAYYKSMTPFITYILVWLVILIQCIPAFIGITLYSLVVPEGLAVSAFEQVFWVVLMILGLVVTTFLLSSSIFASYIVTLPNMAPFTALRSARKLVKYRRFSVIRKVIFLPIFISICFLVLFLPLVILVPLIAEVLFVVLGFGLIVLGHTYYFVLYRALI